MAKNQERNISYFENCVQDPQTILSKALEERNLNDFKDALEKDADPTRIDAKTNTSVFETALQLYGCSEFVDACLKRGCKYNYTNRRLNKCPINFATDSKDPKIVKKLLQFNDIDLNIKYANLTPINSLAKNLKSDNYADVFECIKLLLKSGADPNIPDQRDMTPIVQILRNKEINDVQKKELTTYFLNYSEVDLDSFRNGEARSKINRNFPDIHLPEQNETAISFETLLSSLRNGEENKFIRSFGEYQLNLSERDNQQNITQEENTSLLIESIKKGLNEAVNRILETKVNVNLIENGNSPIEVACSYGNWAALESLIKTDELKLRKFENLLIIVIKKLDEPEEQPLYSRTKRLSVRHKPEFCDYHKCFDILLESNIIDVNATDQSGSAPLHYAVKYKNEVAIKQLLEYGAYIGTKSSFNDIPITEISPDVLEEYFDSCIQTNGCKPGDDDFEIIINYTNLIPWNGGGQGKRSQNSVKQEMLPIEHIAESKELRYLLKHPLITSFLFLKWYRLSLVFYINFILYSLFCASLVTYIMLNFNNSSNENIVSMFRIFSLIGLFYMIIREFLQFLISPIKFCLTPVNWLEVMLIILTVITLCEPNYAKETQRVIAVFTILLASVELCLLVGSLPVLSISTHMLMLQAVSKSFLKSFTLYSIFVITFSLCFYILFGRIEIDNNVVEETNKTAETNGEKDEDEEGEFNKFLNPFTAIIKTIVMLTGEFDAGDIDFNSFTSYIIFLLFVVFMSIVLFNLLNGLAVSDTQAIKSQAELNGCICRTYLLASYERVFTTKNSITGFLIHRQPFQSIYKNLTNVFPNFITGEYIAIMPNSNNEILVSVNSTKNDSQMLLKKNGKVSQFDNEKSLLDTPIRTLPCCCHSSFGNCARMDVRTVKTALNVLEKRQRARKQRDKLKKNDDRLKKVEEKLEDIMNLLQTIVTNQ